VSDQPPATPDDLPDSGSGSLAAIVPRGFARFMDLVVVGLLISIVGNQLIEIPVEGEAVDVPLWFGALAIAMLGIYETVGIAVWGRTLGKVGVRERVVRYDNGEKLRPYQATLRALIPLSPWIIGLGVGGDLETGLLLLYPLIYLSAAINPMRRGLHDLAAGSIVLRTG
jgi:uncharacterized RDD family membrane protein YckC